MPLKPPNMRLFVQETALFGCDDSAVLPGGPESSHGNSYDLMMEVHRRTLRVKVPNPESPHDQLSLLWRLQGILQDALPHTCVRIDLSAYREVPLPLLSVLTWLADRLHRDGRECMLMIGGNGVPDRTQKLRPTVRPFSMAGIRLGRRS